MANAIRALAMDAVEQAKSGHPGLPMGAADIATVLFTRFLKFDPADPAWPDRDRFVLSAGHGSMLLYALFYLLGYEKMTIDEIKRFRQLGSLTPGHPEHGHTPGVETTTGPLGQGLANAVGMAIAERHLAAVFGGDDRRSHDLRARLRRRPDGRHQPGSDRARRPSEAEKADRALRRQWHFDRRADLAVGFRRSGEAFRVRRLGGNAASTATIPRRSRPRSKRRKQSDRPSLIACRTTIGFGAPNKGGTEKSHGSPLGADEIAAARQKLGWSVAAVRNSCGHSASNGAPPASAARPARARLAETPRRARAGQARRVRAPHRAASLPASSRPRSQA